MGFLQSQKAQQIISEYLDKPYSTPPDINPIFDLREPGQEFPPLNPPVATTPDVDPCPPGYQLIDGVCQPIDQFGGNMMEETGGGSDDDMEEQPYFSIDAMRDLSDDEFIDYLSSGFLTNSGMLGVLPSKGSLVTFKEGIPNLGATLLQFPFNQNQKRKDFMMTELMKRGFFTGNFDNNNNPIFDIANKNINTNVGGIESALPQNTVGQPVQDVFGDTYQAVETGGNMGYTFTPSNPSPSVSQQTQGGVSYGTGRGGTQNVKVSPRPTFAVDYEDVYGADI
tara:strand:+ start:181 stop:1023 length:843 start_codon:yes stop_codon:yes gene_type:complete